MKQLILKSLIIISKKNKEAKIVDFDRKLTIITGDNPSGITKNRTGKSLLIKSIYYSLGANLSKYTSNWHNLQIVTLVSFGLNEKEYKLYRDEKRFVLDDGHEKKVFNNISELRAFYVDFFNFKIKLPVAKGESDTIYAYPGAVFMPYYIDQDKGWSGSWDSFNDVFGVFWKTEILLYHLGVRTPEYYTLLEEKNILLNEQNENKRRANTYEGLVEKHIEKYNNFLDISININEFANDIVDLTRELNKQINRRNNLKEKIVKYSSELHEIEELYEVANKNYNELLADADYIDNSIHESTIICPVCGTIHENSIENRFNLFREIQECEEVMETYFKKRSIIEQKLRNETIELSNLQEYINNIQTILNRERKTVTFKDIVIAEGSKSILYDLQKDLSDIRAKISSIEIRLTEISKKQRAITKEGKNITDLYLSKLKNNLLSLDVSDIDKKDLEKFNISFNSGGNDLPCAILAQVYAISEIAKSFSHTITAPIVLDAIFQQEPAKGKIKTIFDFVIKAQPEETQLIISTTDLYGYELEGNIIRLHTEQGLLNEEDYKIAVSEIEEYKVLSLQNSK